MTPVDATGLADADRATALIEARWPIRHWYWYRCSPNRKFDSRPWPIVVSMGVFAVPLIAIFIVILDFVAPPLGLAREAQRPRRSERRRRAANFQPT